MVRRIYETENPYSKVEWQAGAIRKGIFDKKINNNLHQNNILKFFPLLKFKK